MKNYPIQVTIPKNDVQNGHVWEQFHRPTFPRLVPGMKLYDRNNALPWYIMKVHENGAITVGYDPEEHRDELVKSLH